MTDTESHREIRRRPTAAGEARSAVIRRRYDAPIEDVWGACTEPNRLNRWFLQVSGDLRVGGKFTLDGNASGEILRCEPPRLLTVTWRYGDHPPGEVELRLTPGEDGDTVLELEHASVATTVEIDGRTVDIFLNDPESGMWGLGTGWELPLIVGLGRYLRGELPDAPAAEWYQENPEDEELANRLGQAWAAAVQAHSTPIPSPSPPEEGRT